MRFGTDIGGVLIERKDDRGDTSFAIQHLQTPDVPGAIDAVREIALRIGGENVFLVSKCKPQTEQRTLEWLAAHRFHEVTGVPRESVHFCRERVDKAPICRDLGVTHFVDDRLEVLGYLTSVPNRYLFRPETAEVRRFEALLRFVRLRTDSWADIVRDVLTSRAEAL